MTIEEKERVGKYVLQMANFLADGCYQQEMLLKAAHIIDEALEQEPCEDTISRKSLKQKLQEHHDFFINAYGGFSNLPQNNKSRVDEISNCIAMVVNEPPVTPQQKRGQWLNGALIPNDITGHWYAECSECGKVRIVDNYCPNCGAKMVNPQESEV